MTAASFDHSLDAYWDYLLLEKGLSANTLEAYGHDMKHYSLFILSCGLTSWAEVTSDILVSYLEKLREQGLSSSSMNRHLITIRNFHKYLLQEGITETNPAALVELSKHWLRLPDTLSKQEMELIPTIGEHVILFGKISTVKNIDEEIKQRFTNLKNLYIEGFRITGWDKYKSINLKYETRIPCERKND